MKEQTFTANGQTFTAREFTLENYPQAMEAFQRLSSNSGIERRDALCEILEATCGIPRETSIKFPVRETMEAIEVIMAVNGMKREKSDPKAPIPPETGAATA